MNIDCPRGAWHMELVERVAVYCLEVSYYLMYIQKLHFLISLAILSQMPFAFLNRVISDKYLPNKPCYRCHVVSLGNNCYSCHFVILSSCTTNTEKLRNDIIKQNIEQILVYRYIAMTNRWAEKGWEGRAGIMRHSGTPFKLAYPFERFPDNTSAPPTRRCPVVKPLVTPAHVHNKEGTVAKIIITLTPYLYLSRTSS